MRKSAQVAFGFSLATLTFGLISGAGIAPLPPVIAQQISQERLAVTNADAANTPSYALLGVTFNSPEPFSKPMSVSQQGVALLYPPTATPGNEDFKVTLRSLPPDNPMLDALSDVELQQWARFTQLGLQRQPDGRIERTILGRRLVGDVQIERSRRQTVSEIYILPLSSGHRLLLTFETQQRLALQKAEALIGSIADSMQELPNNSKAWRDSFRWEKPKK